MKINTHERIIKRLQIALTNNPLEQNRMIKELRKTWDNDRNMNKLINEALERMNRCDFVQ